MWKTIALAVTVVGTPQLLHLVGTAPQNAPALPAAPAAGASFAATCRGDQILDSRPDPLWVRQTFAGDHCQAPPLPAPLDGARASRDQVVAAMAGARRYGAQADRFARCVSDFVAARRTAHPLTQSQLVIENHRVLVAQRAKQRAADQARVAINRFNEYGSDCPDHG